MEPNTRPTWGSTVSQYPATAANARIFSWIQLPRRDLNRQGGEPQLLYICWCVGLCVCVLTWDLHSLVCIIDCPHIHHHVHATTSKTLVVRRPRQAYNLGMMPVEIVFHLQHKTKKINLNGLILIDFEVSLKNHYFESIGRE